MRSKGLRVQVEYKILTQNVSLFQVNNIDVIALIYGKSGNVMVASRTKVDSLPGNSSKDLFFAWPDPFTEPVSKVEIIPKIDPFTLNF